MFLRRARTKSKSESEPEAEPLREAREPRALSNEYHKARKQLMLWAGILFIWELVGVDLEKAKDAEGNVGAIIKSIKSPQAIPWALLILVSYFAFRLRTEWRQCHATRRQVLEAKQDYYLAFIVAGAACSLYIGQAMSHAQLADRLQSRRGLIAAVLAAMLAAGWVASGWSFYKLIKAWREQKRLKWLLVVQASFGIISFVLYGLLSRTPIMLSMSLNSRWSTALLVNLTAAILFLGPLLHSLRRNRRRPNSHNHD